MAGTSPAMTSVVKHLNIQYDVILSQRQREVNFLN
jgi:hypothetical protein